MDFDAESSSTEAAVAFTTVSEANVEVSQNIADKSAERGEGTEKEEEMDNMTSLKSEVSGTDNAQGLSFHLFLISGSRISLWPFLIRVLYSMQRII